MLYKKAISLFSLVAGLSSASAFASEKPIKQADVPSPVLAALQAKYPRAKLVHFAKEVEQGTTLYEAALDMGTSHVEVSVTPEGKIESEEATISMNDLPDAVRKSFAASRYGKATVKRVERVTDAKKSEATTFELVVTQSGKKYELLFDATGTLARVE
jgi:hypothetical protein